MIEATLDAIRLINDDSIDTYALTFNPRTNKWIVLHMQAGALLLHEAKPVAGYRLVRAISAGDTPEIAARDALILRMPSSKAVPY